MNLDTRLERTMPVVVVRTESYLAETVRSALHSLLAPLGGMRAFVGKGDSVLIKPNFLVAKGVDTAVTTHPELILAVAEAVLEAGAGKVAVGDSPGFGSCRAVARKIGLQEGLGQLGVDAVNFQLPVEVINREANRYRRFELEKAVLEVDKIINLPKIKTHGQMFMTMAVKNTFGCIVGTRKAAWHLEAGRQEDLFATMLLDLHYFVKPVLNIADGIVMMEGNGPGSGTPRHLGLLMASQDAVALDAAICTVLNVPQEVVPTQRVARRAGIGWHDPASVSYPLLSPAEVAIDGIEHPRLSHVGHFLTPRPMLRLTRRLLEVRPFVEAAGCVGCGICLEHCPADAIIMVDTRKGKKAKIAPALCIHCYCCQELCPEGAIRPKRGLVRRLLREPERARDER